jgi:hypothetical protein
MFEATQNALNQVILLIFLCKFSISPSINFFMGEKLKECTIC